MSGWDGMPWITPHPTTWTAAPPTCGYCGGYHAGFCPRIESIEYHENGTVKKVTLRPVEVDA